MTGRRKRAKGGPTGLKRGFLLSESTAKSAAAAESKGNPKGKPNRESKAAPSMRRGFLLSGPKRNSQNAKSNNETSTTLAVSKQPSLKNEKETLVVRTRNVEVSREKSSAHPSSELLDLEGELLHSSLDKLLLIQPTGSSTESTSSEQQAILSDHHHHEALDVGKISSHKEAFGMVEVSSRRRTLNSSEGPLPKSLTQNTTATTSSGDDYNKTNSLLSDVLPTSDFSSYQQMLDNTLWRIRRKNDNQERFRLAMEYCTENLVDRENTAKLCTITWNLLWKENLATSGDSRSAEHFIGAALLEVHLESLFPFLQVDSSDTIEGKASRVQALKALTLIAFWIQLREEQKMTPSDLIPSLMINLQKVLPMIAEGILFSCTSRSVLSQRCVEVIVDLIRLGAETAHRQQDDRASMLKISLWKCASTLDQIWDVQTSWNNTGTIHRSTVQEPEKMGLKKRCMNTILHNWKQIYRKCQHEHDQLRLRDGLELYEVDKIIANVWCDICLGLEIETTPSTRIGGIRQTLLGKSKRLTGVSIVSSLQLILQTANSNAATNDLRIERYQLDLKCSAVLLGVLAWLGLSKKHRLQIEQDASPNGIPLLHSVFETSTALLSRGDLGSTCTDLVLEILSILWSDSYGVPPDFFPSENVSHQEVPDSFQYLVGLLRSETGGETRKELAPSQLAICQILSRCILCKDKSLVSAAILKLGIGKALIEILIRVLQQHMEAPRRSCSQNTEWCINGDSYNHVVDLLLSQITTNKYLQFKMTKNNEVFTMCPLKTTVPRLLNILADQGGGGATSSHVVPIVASSMVSIMQRHVHEGKGDELIREIVANLIRMEDFGKGKAHKHGTKGGAERICSKFAGAWRRSLLENISFKSTCFALVLTSVALEMFNKPDSTVPLTLFGAIVGDGTVYEELTEHRTVARVAGAAIDILKISIEQMKSVDSLPLTESNAVFRRLSPLLLLRRVPGSLFRSARTTADSRSDGFSKQILVYHKLLADQLDPLRSTAAASQQTADERRLAAEIAGRCLPFSDEGQVVGNGAPENESFVEFSCFHRICLPAFKELLHHLFLQESEDMKTVEWTRKARAALYSACHYLPSAHRTDDGDAILTVSSFCLVVLNARQQQISATLDQEFIQLQAGCIEFFAVCAEKDLLLRQTRDNSHSSSRKLIEVCETTSTRDIVSGTNVLVGLQKVGLAVSEISRTGSCEQKWILSMYNHCSNDVWEARFEEFSVPLRTCLWNSLILVAKRCREENGLLELLSRETLPWIIEWGVVGVSKSALRHPLCMAAALQVTFILLTRLKSFRIAFGTVSQNDETNRVRQVHRWALDNVKIRKCDDYEAESIATLRSMALKLLLAVVTVDQINDDDDDIELASCLAPGDIGRTFSVLQGIANIDPDKSLQALASHILSTIKLR